LSQEILGIGFFFQTFIVRSQEIHSIHCVANNCQFIKGNVPRTTFAHHVIQRKFGAENMSGGLLCLPEQVVSQSLYFTKPKTVLLKSGQLTTFRFLSLVIKYYYDGKQFDCQQKMAAIYHKNKKRRFFIIFSFSLLFLFQIGIR
jgi:hypothetical protein